MEVKPDRMVHLGYGKYWRSDAILGLMPIEDDRGPGRRTAVYTATLDEPITASRSQSAILSDMAVASDEHFRMQEAREIMADLLDAFQDLPDVIKRLLANEAQFEVDHWTRRLKSSLLSDGADTPIGQSDLFD